MGLTNQQRPAPGAFTKWASEVLVVYNYVSNEHYSCIWQKQQLLKLYFTVVYQLSYRLGAFTL